MRVLLLGTGMQGRAALHHLVRSDAVSSITAADRDGRVLAELERIHPPGGKVRLVHVDAGDPDALRRLAAGGCDVVIDLLPVAYIGAVAEAAIEAGAHLVNTFYSTDDLRRLAPGAEAAGLILLPELGMDPGIDLLMLAESARGFDRVDEVLSYGAGIPEPRAADNPLRYKISWTFDGVLRSYHRSGRIVRDGRIVDVASDRQFEPANLHEVMIDETGPLEAFPNGDVLPYLDRLGLDPADLTAAGRFTLRYPGHAAFWRTIVELHLLDDEPVTVDGVDVDRRSFLARALEPHLQYRSDEKDMAILRVELAGQCHGRRQRVISEVVDLRDPVTGLTAMSRLVGFSAGIGAQMIARGEIAGRGLLSPLTDVAPAPFLGALAAEGVTVRTRTIDAADAAGPAQ